MLRHAGQPVLGSGVRTWVARSRPMITGLAVGMAAMFCSSSAVAARTTRPTAPQYLFSIPSGSGSLTGRSDQHLTLRLSEARRYLTRFTDLPLRQAAVVANVDFARRFKGYFAGARPNAVLTYTPAGSQIPVSVVLTVGAPRWNDKRFTWTFPATRIRKKPDHLPGTSIHITPPVIPNPHSFTHATLLIDGSSAPVIDGCTIEPHAQCPGASSPIALSGGGVAVSLGRFLQQLFMTSIPWTVGQKFSIGLAVDYSYKLTNPDGADGQTGLMPVFTLPPRGFDPTSDPRVQPKSLMCNVESMIANWQSVEVPAAGGAYIFNLAIYRSGPRLQSPVYTGTLRYAVPPGGVASPGCH